MIYDFTITEEYDKKTTLEICSPDTDGDMYMHINQEGSDPVIFLSNANRVRLIEILERYTK